MYFAFRPDSPEPTEAETPSSVGAAAAELVATSVESLRQACRVEERADSARSTLTASFRKCAVPEIVGRGRVDLPPPPPPDPVPSRPRMKLPGRTAPPPQSQASGCAERCHQVHASCKQSECGQEPASAAEYPNYQRCLGNCQAKHSRCRLSCR